jgi:hypothetical protein
MTHLGHRGGCISLALTCVERSDPQDRVGALSLVRTMRLPSYMLTVKHQGQNTHNYVD